MFILHSQDDLDTLDIALVSPDDPQTAWSFGEGSLVHVPADDVVAFASTGGAFFAPEMKVAQRRGLRIASNPAEKRPPPKVLSLAMRRPYDSNFITGYTKYARDRALYWREKGVGTQPVFAAGVFAISSIQTSIVSCLRLFSLLGPYIKEERLPAKNETLRRIVERSGAGLPESRIKGYRGMVDYKSVVSQAINAGIRDNELRFRLATETDLPHTLAMAKLSFTLALLGNNLGCLDARILNWAFGDRAEAKRFIGSIGKRGGRVPLPSYERYRNAEIEILTSSAYYDPQDPVALARAQWMLWEALGDEYDDEEERGEEESDSRTHTHKEYFDAVVEGHLTDVQGEPL